MKRIRNVAEDFAKKMEIDTLPLEFDTLYRIAEINNWKIVSYSKGYNFVKNEELEEYYYTSDGFTYAATDFTIIFIKDDLAYLDKIDVICHEMGHLVLRHIEIGSNQKSINHCDGIQEQEADIFALQLQAPNYLIKSMDIGSVHQLVKNGIFSRENAALRYKLYKQDFPLVGIIDNFLIAGCITILVFSTFFLIQVISDFHVRAEQTNTYIDYASTAVVQTTAVPASEITEQTTEQAPVQPTQNTTVYITRTGTKYHLPGCRYIKDRKTSALTIAEAENQDYTPCSVCFDQ